MIQLDAITVTVGAFTLRDIACTVPTGSHCALTGPSGAGKTTLLEAICGLNPVTAGRICLMDRDVTALPPPAREIGFVPQDGALFPTMTVSDNLAFPLRIHRWPAARIAARLSELADLLGVAELLDRRPDRLSGGEAQRVALGRALAAGPRVLCLDEPLSALDELARADLCAVLGAVKTTGVTIFHVTHNLREVRPVLDQCLRLEGGRLTTCVGAGDGGGDE